MIPQLLIAFLGGLAIFLTQQKNEKLKRYACLFGLPSQPFFLFETYINNQWGMFALALWYTASWALGLHNFWIKPILKRGEYPMKVRSNQLLFDSEDPRCKMVLNQSQGQQYAFITVLDEGMSHAPLKDSVQQYWGRYCPHSPQDSVQLIMENGGKWPQLASQ